MRNRIIITFIVFSSLLVFSACNLRTINTENNFEKEIVTDLKVVPTKEIQEWKHEPFSGEGKLEHIWSFDAPKPNNERYYGVISIPDGWLIDTNRYPEVTELSLQMATIKPENGEIINSSMTGAIDRRTGVTDGVFVYSDAGMQGSAPHSCWQLSDNSIKWRIQDVSIHGANWSKMSIINGMLFYVSVNSSNQTFFTRLEPATGKIIWSIPFSDRYIVDYAFSQDNAILLFSDSKVESIALLSGDRTGLGFEELEYISMEIVMDSLFLLTSDGFFIRRNLNSLEKETTFQLSENNISRPKLNRLYTLIHLGLCQSSITKLNDTTLLLSIKQDSSSCVYYIFDNQEQTTVELSSDFVYYMNDQLITYKSDFNSNVDTIQSLNPQTLEPIWWIDLTDSDIGENPRVIWCDWRGVLVMSDTKLVCYNAAK
ncbi:MAG TPA: hypothetical protein PKV16_09180 [Caldisericia bacterium]|nr:hypothetical protein [Caldisericia bacterium]HPF49892.1 hypothetical protein [Caldisericia bacterium]HPQ93933.1 hypothetical protein [Caldisericia bacterium]HRV75746.1 hypothetical protein [Caldisericia bacterium]